MNEFLEVLPYLILGLVYFVAQMFSGKSLDGEEPPRRTRRTREQENADSSQPSRPNPLEEFRRIQEEIRRRIEEQNAPQESEPQGYSEDGPTGPQSQETGNGRPTPAPIPVPLGRPETQASVPIGETEINKPPSPFDNPPPRDPFAELAIQRQRAEEARLSLEKAQNESGFRRSQRGSWAIASTGTRSASTASVFATLKNPKSSRQAFLLQEILGTPVSLRQNHLSQKASWES